RARNRRCGPGRVVATAPRPGADRRASPCCLPRRKAAEGPDGSDPQRRQRQPPDGGYTPQEMIPVKEVMTRNVITFREDTPIEEIASTLTSKRITGAPVVANEGHVVGIVSETDVFSKKGKTARDIMSTRVIWVDEKTGTDETACRLCSGLERGMTG